MPSDALQEELFELAFAVCDNRADDEQIDRLEQLLTSEPSFPLLYLQCLELHADMHRRALAGHGEIEEQEESGSQKLETPPPFTDAAADAVSLDEDSMAPAHPPIVLDLSRTVAPSSGFIIPGGAVFSYGVSAMVIGVGLFIAWMSTVSNGVPIQQLAEQTRPKIATNLDAPVEPAVRFVGRVTGMAECQWANAGSAVEELADVPLNQSFNLTAGLLEMTYDTGAKVILEGPCSYRVDSRHGGYLALGKLTAAVEKQEAGEPPSDSERGASSRLSNRPTSASPPSLFAVRTPSAIVTDMGTEFGLEVDASGASRADVFRGKIELRIAEDEDRGMRSSDDRVISLRENESARVEVGNRGRRLVIGRAANSTAFHRQMPRRMPFVTHNTGIGLCEGDLDPHWELTARSDDLKFSPRSAVVTAVRVREMIEGSTNTKYAAHLANDRVKSQWISLDGDMPNLPEKTTYTFRTAFELKNVQLKTAVLRMRFLADDHLTAVRLNGKNIEVPAHGWSTLFVEWRECKATHGFVEGTNVLEFDVHNGGYPGATVNSQSPVALRVELQGSAVPQWSAAAPSDAKAGKEKLLTPR